MPSFADDNVLYSGSKILNAPSWVESDLYDIEAKVASADLPKWQNQGSQKLMLRTMLQAMLADRCNLRSHISSSTIAYYALLTRKHAPALPETPAGSAPPQGAVPISGGGAMIPGNQKLTFWGTSMASLATFLSRSSSLPIRDETGLKGKYSFDLSRIPQDVASTQDPDPPTHWNIDIIGLSLKPQKGTVENLVIDSIQKPSAN